MRTRETASRPNHQPLPAHLDLSALLTLRFMLGCEEFEARFSASLREGGEKTLRDWSVFGGWVCWFSDHPITRSPDHPIPLTLPPRPRSCARKQSVSNPLASGVSSLESRCLAAPNHAASVPLTVKPFAINGSSGTAAWAPFFAKKSKATRLSCRFFLTFDNQKRCPDSGNLAFLTQSCRLSAPMYRGTLVPICLILNSWWNASRPACAWKSASSKS